MSNRLQIVSQCDNNRKQKKHDNKSCRLEKPSYMHEQFSKGAKMKKYVNSFNDDLNAPLDKVERNWLRRPAAIILTIPLFIVMLLLGIVELFVGLFYEEIYKEWIKKLW